MTSSSSLRRLRAASALAGITALSPVVAQAGALAITFGGDGYGSFGQAVTADAYGIPQADWTGPLGSAEAEPDLGGTATVSDVIVTWRAANDWAQRDAFTGAPGRAEVDFGYLDDGLGGAAISLTGLNAWLKTNGTTTYSVRVVNSTDNGNSFTPTEVFETEGGALLGTLVNPATWTGGINSAATPYLTGLSSDTLFLRGGQGVGGQARGGIAAVIVYPGDPPGPLEVVVPDIGITTYVQGDTPDGEGSILNVVNGFGLTKPDAEDPSTWTHDNAWQNGWQGRGDLSLLPDNVGWVVLDLKQETAGLQSLYLWNVNENPYYRLAAGVENFEVYYASDIKLAPPATGPVFQDYSFASGGWTKAGETVTATIGVGSNAPPNAVASLGGVSARYVGLKFLTNYNYTAQGAVLPGTGLAELVVTRKAGTVVPPEPVDFRITDVAWSEAQNGITITWNSQAGIPYAIEFAESPEGPWLPAGKPVQASGSTSTALITSAPAGSPRYFYRVKAN